EHLTYDDVYHPPLSHLTYLWEKSLVGRTYRSIKRSIFPPGPGMPNEADIMLGRTIVDMRAGIAIDPIAEANVGHLNVRGPSRKVAAIANRVAEVYLKQRAQRYEDEAQRAYTILAGQVKLAGQDLQAVERKRLAYTTSHHLMFDFE